jgi:hypothetical protein
LTTQASSLLYVEYLGPAKEDEAQEGEAQEGEV